MHPILLELLPYIKQGYCCSQLLMLLALQLRDEENAALTDSMRGLCHGMGYANAPCGLLGAGAAAVSYLVHSEADAELRDEKALHAKQESMVNDYAAWFFERTGRYASANCDDVVAGLAKEKGNALSSAKELEASGSETLCGELLAESWEKILELCESYDVALS